MTPHNLTCDVYYLACRPFSSECGCAGMNEIADSLLKGTCNVRQCNQKWAVVHLQNNNLILKIENTVLNVIAQLFAVVICNTILKCIP